jgi:hypothetical protein
VTGRIGSSDAKAAQEHFFTHAKMDRICRPGRQKSALVSTKRDGDDRSLLCIFASH